MVINKKDKISKKGILKYLNSDKNIFQINCYDRVTSTNLIAKEKAQQGAGEGYIVIADYQTAGRGRLGRSFFSPSDTGIYFSIVLKPKRKIESAVLITTAAAAATANAIESVCNKQADIKWVNDIFVNDKKVCGILAESVINSNDDLPEYIVLGIGINVYNPNDGFPSEISDTAGYLLEKNEANTKNKLIAKILDNFWIFYERLENKEFFEDYKNRNLAIGKNIIVITPTENKNAKCVGIDDNFRLLVEFENGQKDAISTGEISIRIKKTAD